LPLGERKSGNRRPLHIFKTLSAWEEGKAVEGGSGKALGGIGGLISIRFTQDGDLGA